MGRFRAVSLVAVVLAAFAAMGCAAPAAGGGWETGSGGGATAGGIGQPMPDLVLRRMHGPGTFTLASLRGKIVLLDIWASWCEPCKEEMPVLDAMAARLKSRGVEIVAVSIDTEKAAAEAFLRARPRWRLTLAHDPAGRVAEALQPEKMPSSYVVDGNGVLRHVNTGFYAGDAEKIEGWLLELAGSR
jgi:thiol-disulfide isomerase/thioredoxin